MARRRWPLLVCLLAALAAGCASAPLSGDAGGQQANQRANAPAWKAAAGVAAARALEMVGRPYRFGGASPASGFDCSGLVHYSFQGAGLRVPRTTEQLRQASVPIRFSSLRPGDLLFFDQDGKKNSHVGIYLGDGRFVHAPSSGKRVRNDRLDTTYWREHLSELRRLDL